MPGAKRNVRYDENDRAGANVKISLEKLAYTKVCAAKIPSPPSMLLLLV